MARKTMPFSGHVALDYGRARSGLAHANASSAHSGRVLTASSALARELPTQQTPTSLDCHNSVMNSRLRALIVLAAALALIGFSIVLVRMILISESPSSTVGTVQGILAPLTFTIPLLGAVIGWWWRTRSVDGQPAATRLETAADRLAQVTTETWAREAVVRGIVVPAPVHVRWQWESTLGAARLEAEARTPAGIGPTPLPAAPATTESAESLLESGVVVRLHYEVYARLPQGRLVLVGGPGAGKTGAMILLLLAALDHRRNVLADQRREVPVPVWLTLGGWDPASTSLTEWASDTMVRDHPYLRAAAYGHRVAHDLIRDGRVALFLDGLDEMPAGLRSSALARLQREAINLRIVLTSRPDEFETAQREGRLYGAAVIHVRPVRPRAAIAYLARDQPPRLRAAWAKVGRALETDPDSVLARALDNPLMLSLARATYREHDPTELAAPGRFKSVQEIREHLVDQLLVTTYPDETERARVTHWLGWMAHHLGSTRDIAWWLIPGWAPRRRLRLLRRATDAIIGSVALWLAVFVGEGFQYAPELSIFLPAGAVAGLGLGALTQAVTTRFALARGGPVRLRPRLPRSEDVVTFLPAFVTAWLITLVALLASLSLLIAVALVRVPGSDGPLVVLQRLAGYIYSLPVGLFLIAIPLPVAVIAAFCTMWSMPIVGSAASTARTIYTEDRRAGLLVALVLTPLIALAVSVVLQVILNVSHGIGNISGMDLVRASLASLVGGAGAGLVIGSKIGSTPDLLMTEIVLARRPLHLVRLLSDACNRNVLRQAGTVWQFRHAELQDRMARQYRVQHLLPTTIQPAPIAPIGRSSRVGQLIRNRLAQSATGLAVLLVLTLGTLTTLRQDHVTLVTMFPGGLTFSSDGSTLFAVGSESILVRDQTTGRSRHRNFQPVNLGSPFPILSPGGQAMIDQRQPGQVEVIDPSSGTHLTTVATGTEQDLESGAVFQPKGDILMWASAGQLHVARAGSGTAPRTWGALNGLVLPNPSGGTFAVLSDDDIEIRDVETGSIRHLHAEGLHVDKDRRTALSFDPLGSAIVVADETGIRVADVSTGKVSPVAISYHENIAFVAISPDRTKLAAVYDDLLIRIWDTQLSTE
jgi:hypothetical protein